MHHLHGPCPTKSPIAPERLDREEFDVDIVYRSGRKNAVCDALSRYNPAAANTITTIQRSDLQPQKIREEQDQCDWIAQYKQALREGTDLNDLLGYVLIDDILYIRYVKKFPPFFEQD
ncbi:hypothetical protein ANCDUO_22408 [Ancylostoma duodenale]|uniref:Reverse transcriptase RNase H-like domain-containing protein n=1 Tax=Ancylostoma duodenale TaxID=51022 RepID=A0A0C2BUB6_9BILA|nr:hypothetical protein ANCDUO_22408 [Ancylostoma duodenale]